MPLLHILSVTELRAVLAHELAHLVQGDAGRSARGVRFVSALERGLDPSLNRAWGPLRAWAALCHRWASVLLEPLARGQEARADRLAAALAGGPTTASALVKVALVQPLFREVLARYDPAEHDRNLYAFFRAFWSRLPEPLLTDMRHRLLAGPKGVDDSAHPPLLERLSLVQRYPDVAPGQLGLSILDPEKVAASATLGDPQVVEQVLHDRLFQTPRVERSVFHRSGT
jgi:Zn-dependent protease with chaperone function